MEATIALNRPGVRRYIDRISDRWQLRAAYIGGPALNGDEPEQAFDVLGTHFTVVLVSDAFDEIPWLERTYIATSLWDAMEMGAPVQTHCYTPLEFERKRPSSATVQDVIWHGLDLVALI